MEDAERALLSRAERTLGFVSARVALIRACTPRNFESELLRLSRAHQLGELLEPSFEYATEPASDPSWDALLAQTERELAGRGPLAELYAARAAELRLELEMCAARASARLPALARARYATEASRAQQADALALVWLAEPAAVLTSPTVLSDDESDPRSLVCRLRQVIGERRLPVRVLAVPSLVSLAATGDGVVQVACRRSLAVVDVERTVLHEVDGHVAPGVRARSASTAIFAIGTARGSDTQEGWALLVEERAGHLSGARRRELALRHLAARAAHQARPFAEVVGELCERGAPITAVLRAALRAYRGGGLGREAAYLPALLEVREALSEEPALEPVITSGRVSVSAARELARYAELLPAFSGAVTGTNVP